MFHISAQRMLHRGPLWGYVLFGSYKLTVSEARLRATNVISASVANLAFSKPNFRNLTFLELGKLILLRAKLSLICSLETPSFKTTVLKLLKQMKK